MGKSSATLEEGLSNSAQKKGYSGKERQRYIGGAIRNMEKRGEIKKIQRKAAKPKVAKVAHKPAAKTVHKKVSAPRQPVEREVKATPPKIKIKLLVKKNGAVSKQRGFDVYSLYKESGEQFNDATFRKRSVALSEANAEMNAYNGGYIRKKFK